VWLTTEDFGDTPDVTEEQIDRIMLEDAFGKFAVLSESETSFIQAGNDWQPSDECESFVKSRGSDPWLLEYRDGPTARQLRARGHVTLEEVRQVFVLYLGGDQSWRAMFDWREIQ